jgi:hypothetical protein
MGNVKLFKDRYPGFSIKGLKYFRGMEGDGLNATLYKDGRRICLVIDEANGGEYNYEGLSAADEKMLKEFVEVKRAEMPDVKNEYGSSDRELLNLDWMISDMCVAWEFEAKLRRMTKKKTVFITPDCKSGEARTLNHPFDAKAKDSILKKYPEAVILNEVLV